MIIAITGTIGAGKSSVARFFKEKGYPVFDSDKMVHAYYEPQAYLYDRLYERYGTRILTNTKEIDRQKLANIVFNNPKELLALEALVFPKVKEEIINLKKMYQQQIIFVEVPLLFEAKLEGLFDKIITVDAFKEIRYQRLKNKGLNMKDILARENRQYGSRYKKKHSDIIINNNKDLNHLKRLLKEVEEKVRA